MMDTTNKVAKILASVKGEVDRLTNSQVNRYLDRLDEADSLLCQVFIDAGRGYELPSETMQLDDPLARLYRQAADLRSTLRFEVSRRYGPSAPSRLPTRR